MPWASLCPSLNNARILFLMRAQCLSCPQLRKVCFAVTLLSGFARSSLPARSASPSAIYCARFLFCVYFQIGIFIYRFANYRQSPRLRLLPFTFAFALVGSSARGVAFLCPAGRCLKSFRARGAQLLSPAPRALRARPARSSLSAVVPPAWAGRVVGRYVRPCVFKRLSPCCAAFQKMQK